MNVFASRKPETALAKACPAYKKALLDFERALSKQDDDMTAAAWQRVAVIAEIFWQGVEFARKEFDGQRGGA